MYTEIAKLNGLFKLLTNTVTSVRSQLIANIAGAVVATMCVYTTMCTSMVVELTLIAI